MSLHDELSSLLHVEEPVLEVKEKEKELEVRNLDQESPVVAEPLPRESPSVGVGDHHHHHEGEKAVVERQQLGEQEHSETPVGESVQSAVHNDQEPVAEDPAPSNGKGEEEEEHEVVKEPVAPSIPHEEPAPSPADPVPAQVKRPEETVKEAEVKVLTRESEQVRYRGEDLYRLILVCSGPCSLLQCVRV